MEIIMIQEKSRLLQQANTKRIKNRQKNLLTNLAQNVGVQVNFNNIVLNQGKVQPTFRLNYV